MKYQIYLRVVLSILLTFCAFGVAESAESEFHKIVTKAQEEGWGELPYNDVIVKVGEQFLGVPYVGGTLDENATETCTIELDKLDCVTYFEDCLAIADVLLTESEPKFSQLYDRVQYTRYRDGVIDGYVSRLHYTSDWIMDNVNKNVVEDITKELGGVPLELNVHFMSAHSDKYPKLKGKPKLIEQIKKIEANINSQNLYYIPKDKISGIMERLQNGDIVAFVTTVDGLDYGHIGLINKEDGVARLMHASSTAKKVVLDKPLDEYINGVSKFSGITVLRPIQPIK
jgi:hypothetical protein